MMTKSPPLNKSLEEIAKTLAQRLKTDDSLTTPELIQAFRALTTYWAVKNKVSPPSRDIKGVFDGYADEVARSGKRGGAGDAARIGGTLGIVPSFDPEDIN